MNTFIRQKAEETDRQTDKQTNNVNSIKHNKNNQTYAIHNKLQNQ